MCGIAGFISNVVHAQPQDLLRAMGLAIAHRGPDDQGVLVEQAQGGAYQVGLIHLRLSIIDLSTGHQPLGNEDGSIQIIFNGEVYNFQTLRDELIAAGHVFRTKSDTETIVHAYEQWGVDCVKRLRGMFAFAIWDRPRQRLFIARDRYGKKPLFIHQNNGQFVFASEIKAILKYPGVSAKVDLDSIWDYLGYRYVPGPQTLFQGIRKLEPGCSLVWENGAIRESRYFVPDDAQPWSPQNAEPADVVGAFLEQLDEAVRIRMISDVPFGAFLSGGIDSSAVVGLMARHSALPIKTFSVGFAEGGYSELGYAKTIADLFKTDHHELSVSEREVIDLLPKLVGHRDAPVSEPSDVPIYLLSVEARKTVKMVLTGEGSDEFLGGYPKHRFEHFVQMYQAQPALLRNGLIEPLVRALPYRFRRAKTAIANLSLADPKARMERWFGALTAAERTGLLRPGIVARPAAGAYQFRQDPRASSLRKILYFDQTSWLPDNLLERGDRMTMAASIEARMPFMDHELAAFVSRLPDQWRVQGGTSKRILRLAMQRMLPREILERPKVGFRVPVNEWFQHSMKDYLLDHLLGADSRTLKYFNRPALQAIVDEHVSGRQNHEKTLWCLLNLEIWHRQYGIA